MATTTLDDYLAQLDQLQQQALQRFRECRNAQELEQVRVEYLGAKRGVLRQVQQRLKELAPEEKPQAGKRFNELKKTLEAALEEAKQRVAASPQPEKPAKEKRRRGAEDLPPPFDPTAVPPQAQLRLGRLHPVTQTIRRMKEVMARLGFEVADGPEVEDPWHNFEALNIPEAHPARDPLDNFYLSTARLTEPQPRQEEGPQLLLRSQTSTVQIRVMEKRPAPVRVIALGRVYRPDTADATHFPMFHQMEGLYVDRGVTMAQLKTVLRLFASMFFGPEVQVRFRPSFFPFTEPSVEVDMTWKDGWIEMGGAGMVDPAVLQAVGYDPEQVTGFAFGLGVERVCMRQYGIDDIRLLYRNDVRFLQQF